MNTITFVSSQDRKTLTVVTEVLAYAMRELADLKAGQPELSSAIEKAHRISRSLSGSSGDIGAAGNREASS